MASCKSALNPSVVNSTDRSKAVFPVLVLLFVALWLFYDAICFMSYLVLFCSCVFSVFLALRLPRLGKRELILVLFVRLFDLRLFGFVCFLFLLGSGKGYVFDCGTPWSFLLLLFTFCLRGRLTQGFRYNMYNDFHFSKTTYYGICRKL